MYFLGAQFDLRCFCDGAERCAGLTVNMATVYQHLRSLSAGLFCNSPKKRSFRVLMRWTKALFCCRIQLHERTAARRAKICWAETCQA